MEFLESTQRKDLEILDRIGGGDSFASGLIYGLLAGKGTQWALECGTAHAALATTTPGDTSVVTLKEVERLMSAPGARITRCFDLGNLQLGQEKRTSSAVSVGCWDIRSWAAR